MTDREGLRALVRNRGLKWKAIAEKMGITTQCLRNKVDGETQFKVNEIELFSQAVGGLTDGEQRKYFFAQEVDK